jgi:two-component system chemotaxis response regulator CheB
VYVAPPGLHMMLTESRISLERGARENGHRPSVDVLFRSAARTFGPRVIGVVLSGALDDGAAGIAAIKAVGGTAVVQDPEEALARGMPGSAINAAAIDYIVPTDEIGGLLGRLVAEPLAVAGSAEQDAAPERDRVAFERDVQRDPTAAHPPISQPSVYTCPECQGTLYEFGNGELARFRCRVGHAHSAESLAAAHGEAEERALWAAVRALEEGASLARRLASNARGSTVSRRFTERADENERRASLIRKLLLEPVATDAE